MFDVVFYKNAENNVIYRKFAFALGIGHINVDFINRIKILNFD